MDDKFEKNIRKNYPNMKSMQDLPKLGAFITFNKTSEALKCVDKHSFLNRRNGSNKLVRKKANTRHTIKAILAENPTDILWENLEVGKCDSCC